MLIIEKISMKQETAMLLFWLPWHWAGVDCFQCSTRECGCHHWFGISSEGLSSGSNLCWNWEYSQHS